MKSSSQRQGNLYRTVGVAALSTVHCPINHAIPSSHYYTEPNKSGGGYHDFMWNLTAPYSEFQHGEVGCVCAAPHAITYVSSPNSFSFLFFSFCWIYISSPIITPFFPTHPSLHSNHKLPKNPK